VPAAGLVWLKPEGPPAVGGDFAGGALAGGDFAGGLLAGGLLGGLLAGGLLAGGLLGGLLAGGLLGGGLLGGLLAGGLLGGGLLGGLLRVLQVGVVMVSVSRVTAPLRARTRPSMVTPVVTLMEVRARMLPRNTEAVPRVAELPTCQNTWQAWAPLGPATK